MRALTVEERRPFFFLAACDKYFHPELWPEQLQMTERVTALDGSSLGTLLAESREAFLVCSSSS